MDIMEKQPHVSAWSLGEATPFGISRRSFLEKLAAVGGTTLLMSGMEALGFSSESKETAPPALTKGKSAKVVVLGAGLSGMTAAYELLRAGYDVQILEARSFAGGRCQTVRKGFRDEELTGAIQTCDFDEGLYLNAGPWRIPYHHHSTLHYVREFNVPLEVFVNDNDASYVLYKNGKGPLAGKRLRKGELTTDMRGYTAEILAKVVRQGALDSALSLEDRDRFVEYLIRDGSLTGKDLVYTGIADRGLHAQSVGRGYIVRQGAGVVPGPGVMAPPFAMTDILSAGGWRAITNAAVYEHPTTMFQPVGGMDMIAKGFERQLKPKIQYSTLVEKITQSGSGVKISYRTASGTPGEISADYCICTIPLSVLARIEMDVSEPFRAAMQSCPYAPVNKVSLQMKQRFWEENHEIYGGHILTDEPDIGYISLPSGGWMSRKGIILGIYGVFGSAVRVSGLAPAERIRKALAAGQEIFPEYTSSFETGFCKAWHLDKFNLGGWANWSDEGRRTAYPLLCEPDGRIYLSGEHLSYQAGWQAGAIASAWAQVEKLHARVQQA